MHYGLQRFLKATIALKFNIFKKMSEKNEEI